MHQGQGSRTIDISIIIRVIDHRYVHHTHTYSSNIQQGQGSKINASYTPVSRSRVIGKQASGINIMDMGMMDTCILDAYLLNTCIPTQ